ncbi:YybH family protein [Sinorhizobium americanum]|uniref:YybH family protein n=1 Tax=Sinorhizobium americanum TaxID=194963 RepID=UPI00055C4F25|nr:nuclear transport factor 2 family protein [Sinorhizobium americanum]OAP38697.1 steroid delta-isomerase [Sinorhizobium americanum]
MKPREMVEEWIRRFNRRDAIAVAELYREDALHLPAKQRSVEGRFAIQKMFEEDFAVAGMTCVPEVIYEIGGSAVLEWRDPSGRRGCGVFAVRESRISFAYWDERASVRMQNLPIQ